ncbi:dithiol-disulfide isomerase [Arsenicibacter rosenii]|uniref:Dithiol-disulfide isomerase n=2 Tax=Arsenicibacter rosenii TaxID=1750698 RepID=A0A1S2VL89_9BACT|nr:dithiol-disulfide isomerase [Arsenicibacter rosenii]
MVNNNPLLCDPETGICELPAQQTATAPVSVRVDKKPLTITYFTDPICSTCWGIEPQLRKLKLEYGDGIHIDYHMGGLLPDWSYNSGGISKPSDVAHHWDEVSRYYQMPIDGDVWLEDPLHSSYPPSIAFKAAQLQDEKKALVFLRIIREMVFLEKKNITKWEHLSKAAIDAGLDAVKLKQDYEGPAQERFRADLELARKLGVRGFPSVYITDMTGNREFIYGFKPYAAYETGITKLYPKAGKRPYDTSWQYLFNTYPTLTTREFAELSGLSFQEADQQLLRLVHQQMLTSLVTKNGVLWKRITR